MKNTHGKLEQGFLHRIQIKFNMFCNLREINNQIKKLPKPASHSNNTSLIPDPEKPLMGIHLIGKKGKGQFNRYTFCLH